MVGRDAGHRRTRFDDVQSIHRLIRLFDRTTSRHGLAMSHPGVFEVQQVAVETDDDVGLVEFQPRLLLHRRRQVVEMPACLGHGRGELLPQQVHCRRLSTSARIARPSPWSAWNVSA